MIRFKPGVYLKPNGKLVLLTRENSKERWKYNWSLLDGRKTTNKMVKLMFGNCYMAWESHSDNETYDAWGPSSYLNRCEYLGEL